MKNEVDKLALNRLLQALKLAGVETGSRNRTVAKKTGYSEKTVANILSGNAKLTPRFITVASRSFGLNGFWIEFGEKTHEEVEKRIDCNYGLNGSDESDLISFQCVASKSDTFALDMQVKFSRLLNAASKDIACIEAVNELLKMSEIDRWRAVAMLKGINDDANK